MATCKLAAFDVTARLALTSPSVTGAKTTGTLQLLPTARLLPQVLPAPRVNADAPLILMDVNVKATLPVLDKLICCVTGVAPTVCAPKASTLGVAVIDGVAAAALPARLMTALPLDALLAIFKAAANAPAVVGVACKVTVHCPPAATAVWVLHVPPTAKIAAFAPLKAMELKFNAAWPLLLTVTVCSAEAAFTSKPAKLRLLADTDRPAWAATLPVPLRATWLSPPVAL